MCITANANLDVTTLDEANVTEVSFETNSSIGLTFKHRGGSITSVSVQPAGPSISGHTITFDTSNCSVGTEYSVTVVYTNDERDGGEVGETPTKIPKFKPVNSCTT